MNRNIDYEKIKTRNEEKPEIKKSYYRIELHVLPKATGASLRRVYSAENNDDELIFLRLNVLYCDFLTLLHHCFEIKKHVHY